MTEINYTTINRRVWNTMKMSDIGFLKPNRTDLKIQ